MHVLSLMVHQWYHFFKVLKSIIEIRYTNIWIRTYLVQEKVSIDSIKKVIYFWYFLFFPYTKEVLILIFLKNRIFTKQVQICKSVCTKLESSQFSCQKKSKLGQTNVSKRERCFSMSNQCIKKSLKCKWSLQQQVNFAYIKSDRIDYSQFRSQVVVGSMFKNGT